MVRIKVPSFNAADAARRSTSSLEVGMWMRATVAFFVAPAIGALGASLVGAAMWSIYAGFFFSALMVAYAITLLAGVPAFLLSRSWLPLSLWAYALVGAVVAAVAAVPMVFYFPLSLAFLSIVAGAITGVMFRLIAMPTSNNIGGAVRLTLLGAAGAGRQCAPSAPVWRGRPAPQLHR